VAAERKRIAPWKNFTFPARTFAKISSAAIRQIGRKIRPSNLAPHQSGQTADPSQTRADSRSAVLSHGIRSAFSRDLAGNANVA